MKYISILGSTGSIGTQTLDVVRENKDKISVCAISGNENIELLKNQILEFSPELCAVMNEANAIELKKLLPSNCRTEIVTKMDGLISVAVHSKADIIVTAVSGMVGLKPTIEAIKLGKTIALANKETLVAGGEYIMNLVKKHKAVILPVDSEHSAIFQSISANKHEEINKLIITASGGPFRGKKLDELANVTVAEALKHPNWSMGKKITIDSATLMNKGLELIEARFLFDVPVEKIEIIVHPQSIIHSAVEYIDHSIIAQLGEPNMRVPIQYALFYPDRMPNKLKPISFTDIGKLTFEKPDTDVFKCLRLATEALKIGGTMPAVLNAANEASVELFLKDKIKFLDIADINEQIMLKHSSQVLNSLEVILESESWVKNEIKKIMWHNGLSIKNF